MSPPSDEFSPHLALTQLAPWGAEPAQVADSSSRVKVLHFWGVHNKPIATHTLASLLGLELEREGQGLCSQPYFFLMSLQSALSQSPQT